MLRRGRSSSLYELPEAFHLGPNFIATGVVAFRRLDPLRERSKRLIETNRAIYRAFAQRHGYDVPQYGTVAFPRVMDGSTGPLCDALYENYETAMVPGEFFEMPEHVRISLAVQPGEARANPTTARHPRHGP